MNVLGEKMISPSLLSADFVNLHADINKVTEAGANLLHLDIMDGHFVPNLTFGMPVVKSISKVSQIPLDVHLMIDEPEKYILDFINAGANFLTIHVESTNKMSFCLDLIRENKVKPGITLRPQTTIDKIEPYLSKVDLVLVMTVEPGFGGQSFRHEQLEKVRFLYNFRKQNDLDFLIEVDGGVNSETAKGCWSAGCDILVAGSAVFKGQKTVENYKQNIQSLRP